MPIYPGVVNGGQTFIGPSADGSNGQVVATDGSGSLTLVTRATQADLDLIRANLALLAFRRASDHGIGVQNMVDGITDEFEDQAGVDDTASTNETYDASSDYYSNAGSTSNITPTLDANSAGFVNYTIRQVINASEISGDGTSIVVTFRSSTSSGFKMDTVYIAEKAASGNAWDYAAGTKAQLLFSGGSFGSVPSNSTLASDALTFTIDQTKSYVIGIDCNSDSGNDDPRTKISLSGYSGYYKAATDAAATDAPSGLSSGNSVYAISNIAVTADPVDMTLISEDFTAESTPTDALLILFQEDVDAATVNTDVKGYVSRDGGTNYTQVTLTDESDYATGKRILMGSADISGQPSGTTMKWKITTHNTKGQRIHGVALQWR